MIDRASEFELGTKDLRALDTAVFDLYELSASTRAALRRHFAGFAAPEGTVRYPPSDSRRTNDAPHNDELRQYGAVMDVRPDEIKLWVPELTPEEGQWMPLPRRFLGRHVRAGATFEVTTRDGNLHDGLFEFQPDSYLELEDFAECET